MVVYSTPHEGGELVLNHEGHEWKFDPNILTASRSPSSLAYVAFCRDIKYGVLPVKAGRSVTVTYNLYIVDPSSKSEAPTPTEDAQSDSNLQDTLQRLLKSPEFLPEGATLGFGLAHLYPVAEDTDLEEMEDYLKGEDAHVYQVCQELQLQPELKIIYDDYRNGEEFGIMLDTIPSYVGYDPENGETYEEGLMSDCSGVSVNKTEHANMSESKWASEEEEEEEEEEGRTEFITWVSPFNGRNKVQDLTVTLGNDVNPGIIYCSPCIIARIDAASDRM